MERHIPIVAWLYIGLSIVNLVVAAFLFVIFVGMGFVLGGAEAAGLGLGAVIGMFVSMFLVITALPGLIGGMGLLNEQNWARIVLIIVALLNLCNFPLGTILSIYTFWVLFNRDVEYAFKHRYHTGLRTYY